MDYDLMLAWFRISILVFMLGFTLRHRDWLGVAVVVVYSVVIFAHSILHMNNVASFGSTPLLFLISWYIINSVRRKG